MKGENMFDQYDKELKDNNNFENRRISFARILSSEKRNNNNSNGANFNSNNKDKSSKNSRNPDLYIFI